MHMWNLLSSLEYVPKLMVASLCIIAHLHALNNNQPSVLSTMCMQWRCNLQDLRQAIFGLSPHSAGQVMDILKMKMGMDGLNMLSVSEWMPGARTGIQVGIVTIPFT